MADGAFQGYSPVLALHLRWEQGRLRWHNPETGRPIATLAEERARADREHARARSEYEARTRAEARARELEAELRRLRGQ